MMIYAAVSYSTWRSRGFHRQKSLAKPVSVLTDIHFAGVMKDGYNGPPIINRSTG